MIKCALQYGDILQIELKCENVGFSGEEKHRNTWRKTSQGRDKNQQQTQPTYDSKSRNLSHAITSYAITTQLPYNCYFY